MNRLPKYWIVKNDFSQKYKDSVLKYLNQEYNSELQGLGEYYGNDNDDWSCYSSIDLFKNNNTLNSSLLLNKDKNIILILKKNTTDIQ